MVAPFYFRRTVTADRVLETSVPPRANEIATLEAVALVAVVLGVQEAMRLEAQPKVKVVTVAVVSK